MQKGLLGLLIFNRHFQQIPVYIVTTRLYGGGGVHTNLLVKPSAMDKCLQTLTFEVDIVTITQVSGVKLVVKCRGPYLLGPNYPRNLVGCVVHSNVIFSLLRNNIIIR